MKKTVFFLLILCTLLASAAAEPGADTQRILGSINQIRRNHQLEPLLPDPILTSAAATYAGVCVEQGYLSHKDERGGYAVDRVRKLGGTALKIGEILGTGQNAEAVIEEWLNSPSHRSIIINEEWTHAGGAVIQTDHGFAAVVLFQMKPFSRISTVSDSAGMQIRLSREGFEDFQPVLFSRGSLIEAESNGSGNEDFSGTETLFYLSHDQVFYHILVGLKRNEELIFTDRIFLP